MKTIEQKYYDWEEKIEDKYRSLFPGEYLIFDGVIDPEKYYKEPLKVLIMNKEPYDEENVSYNICHAIKDEIRTCSKSFKYSLTFRRNLFRWLKVIFLINRTDFDLLKTEQIESLIGDFDESRFRDLLGRCAYINIKKSNGVKQSNNADLSSALRKGFPVIMEQLRFINPSIILGGNISSPMDNCDEFTWSEKALCRHNNSEALWELKVNESMIPFIDNYHPSAISYRGGCSSQIAFDLFEVIHSKDRSYWSNYMNKKCFDL